MERGFLVYRGSLLFGEMSGLPKLTVELAAMSVLEDQEDSLLVVEPSVESEYVGMVETRLNGHLSLQLVVHVVLLDLLLEYHLQRHYEFTLPNIIWEYNTNRKLRI